MARPQEKIEVTCPNPRCHYYLKEEGRDIIKAGKYKSTGHQRYYCKHCRTYFMETKGTALYRKHLSEDEIIEICKHLVEKDGIRSIERITGHHRDTIGRLLEDLAEHAEDLNDYFIHDVGFTPFECGVLWTMIKKHRIMLSVKAQQSLMRVLHESEYL